MGKSKAAEWMTEEKLLTVAELAAKKTDGELAAAMSIAPSTLYAWINKYPEFSDAVERGRRGEFGAAAIKEVENSLYDRCLGGLRTVKKAVKLKEVKYDKSGRKVSERERVELAEEEVYIPADVNAIKFFLTNRAGDRWKNKTELGTEEGPAELIVKLAKEAEEYGG